MSIKIIVPSKGRASNVLTKIDSQILCVDINEFDEYRKFNDCEIITHNSLKNLSSIRQFLYENYKDLFMVDDDIVSVERLYNVNNQKLTEIEIKNIIDDCYYNAKNIGAKLFGFNNDPNPVHYNQHKPFMLNGYINGCAIGLIQDKHLFFNENTTACESHWINLLNAYYNRFCFIDKRFHFRQKENSTFLLEGGQTGKRTMQTEKYDTILLKKIFGDSVVVKKEKNKTKQLHEYQRQLNIRLW